MIRALTAAAILIVGPVAAQTGGICGDRESVVQMLADRYGEARQSMGLQHDGIILEMFANVETGTWTVLLTYSSGMTCLVATGEAWQQVDDDVPPGDPA